MSAEAAAFPPPRDPASGAVVAGRVRAARWTVRKLLVWARNRLGIECARETLRKTLVAMGMSWKKGKKLLARASAEARGKFVVRLRKLLRDADNGAEKLVFIDEAHVHQEADLGRTWSRRGQRYYVSSSTPGLSARVSFFGAYIYDEVKVAIYPVDVANGDTTQDVLEALRAAYPNERLRIVWDGASYHVSGAVRAAARKLDIKLTKLPAYSPDLMPVEALWRWLREEVTYNHCHATKAELVDAVCVFEDGVNADEAALFARLAIKTSLRADEEKLRLS